MQLKPLETYYRGYRFRSRLEARWAVFFQEVGLAWKYEVEGYDLGSQGKYLPDFEVGDFFIEIKPEVQFNFTTEILPKCRKLSQLSGRLSLVLVGNPWPDEYDVFWFPGLHSDSYPSFGWLGESWESRWKFSDCRRCQGVGLSSYLGQITLFNCTCTEERWKGVVTEGERVLGAFSMARPERFGT